MNKILEELYKKYSRNMGITENEVKKMIKDALISADKESKLLEVVGLENIEDVSILLDSQKVELAPPERYSNYEEFDYITHVEYKFIPVETRKHEKEALIRTNTVNRGIIYFKFPHFNYVQSKVYDSIYNQSYNVLVSAPTGSGKTEIAILSIIHELRESSTGKIVYIAPMKALATEISIKLSNIFINLVCEYTGDTEISSTEAAKYQIFICTPEKFEVVTRRNGNFFEESLKLLIIDEIHILQEDRGAVLESIVCRTFKFMEIQQTQIRIIGLSATVPNIQDVAKFIKAAKYFSFDDSYRPVTLNVSMLGVFGKVRKNGTRREEASKHDILKVCIDRVSEALVGEKQVLVFTHSRNDTLNVAMSICKELGFKADPTIPLVSNSAINNVLKHGVGIHHAGLSKQIRHAVEKLFFERKLRVMVCTSTLAWGVNLPASTVIIKGTSFYDPSKGCFSEISILDVIQIFGRAGRPQFEPFGNGLLITSKDKLNLFKNRLMSNTPIESQMLKQIVDLLNSEISLGRINGINDAKIWIEHTFFYIRAKKNPEHYGIETNEDIHKVIGDYIVLSLKRLEEYKMIRICSETTLSLQDQKDWRVESTMFGRVACLFYVSHSTMKLWIEGSATAKDTMDILKVISASSEFNNVLLRHDEISSLIDLADSVQLEFKESVECKMLLLMFSIFQGINVSHLSLNCDKIYITKNLERLIPAMIQVLFATEKYSFAIDLIQINRKLKYNNDEDITTPSWKIIDLDTFIFVELKYNVDGMKYILMKCGNDVVAGELYHKKDQFYFKKREGNCSFEAGMVDKKHDFTFNVDHRNIQLEQNISNFIQFGVHLCSEMAFKVTDTNIQHLNRCCKITQGHPKLKECQLIKNYTFSIQFKDISNLNNHMINSSIYEFVRDKKGKIAIVVEEYDDVMEIIRFIEMRSAIEPCGRANRIKCISSGLRTDLDGEFQVFVGELSKVYIYSGWSMIVFKRCSRYNICEIFGLIKNIPTYIMENNDYCIYLNHFCVK